MKQKLIHLVIITITIAISWALALTHPDLNKLELGALANYYFPPIIGLITLVIYLLLSWLQKSLGNLVLVFCCIINFAVGIAFRFFDF